MGVAERTPEAGPPPREAEGFDRFLLLLGRLNYSWTNTESLLIHLVAGLSRCDKETAVVIFLTLNTTRARIDLVERLAKLDRVSQDERNEVLAVTRAMARLAGVRNQYNHCIYSFNSSNGDLSTIRMRVADRKNQIKVGEMSSLNDDTIGSVEAALTSIARLNAEIWALVRARGYPA